MTTISISFFCQKMAAALLLSLTLIVSQSLAAQQFESGEYAVPLIELYTSEGCSSCPPADRWLSQLREEEALWSGFVPLAFHVDYWDYIGWKDPFAHRAYSQRQRRYAREYKESTVYTPGLRKGGKEWRGWYLNGDPTNSEQVEAGMLKVEVKGRRFAAHYARASQRTQLNIAVLGLGLSTEVKRGENHGKTLKHDFVVLGISQYVIGEDGTWRGELPKASQPAPDYAVAAWVSEDASLTPIQATGGLLSNITQ